MKENLNLQVIWDSPLVYISAQEWPAERLVEVSEGRKNVLGVGGGGVAKYSTFNEQRY